MSDASESQGGGITRWIIVGVLSVGLVALLLLGGEGTTPQPVGDAVPVEAGGGENAQIAPDEEPVAYIPPDPADDTDLAYNEKLTEACAGVADRIGETYGVEFQETVGKALRDDAGIDGDALMAFCAQMEELPFDEMMVKLSEKTGITPPG